MAAATSTLRRLPDAGFILAFTVYDDLHGDCPARLDITGSGCYIDGKPDPGRGRAASIANDAFLKTWIGNIPNTDDEDATEEPSLSFFSPGQPAGPYSWAMFEFEKTGARSCGFLLTPTRPEREFVTSPGLWTRAQPVFLPRLYRRWLRREPTTRNC